MRICQRRDGNGRDSLRLIAHNNMSSTNDFRETNSFLFKRLPCLNYVLLATSKKIKGISKA
jgi:hypothetical protein